MESDEPEVVMAVLSSLAAKGTVLAQMNRARRGSGNLEQSPQTVWE